jgi:Asp-tRNA(Asn)/Glu-tRNA(Gln) amidotransferase A subunit family amidase
MINLLNETARTIAEAVRRRELTAVAVTQSVLEQIARLNPTLHLCVHSLISLSRST